MELYVVIENSRNQNIGTTLRCAIAFGAKALLVVGSDKFSTHGAHGAQKHIQIQHFFYWMECVDYLRSRECIIYGVVDKDAISKNVPVRSVVFRCSSAFIIPINGNLKEDQITVCDQLVYVEFPSERLERVHNDVKSSICLHHFASTVVRPEREFVHEKFLIDRERYPSQRGGNKGKRKALPLTSQQHYLDMVSDFSLLVSRDGEVEEQNES